MPRYEHDCEECVFLGRHLEFDLYHHPGKFETVVARMDKDGEYLSGMWSPSPPLVEARARINK